MTWLHRILSSGTFIISEISSGPFHHGEGLIAYVTLLENGALRRLAIRLGTMVKIQPSLRAFLDANLGLVQLEIEGRDVVKGSVHLRLDHAESQCLKLTKLRLGHFL